MRRNHQAFGTFDRHAGRGYVPRQEQTNGGSVPGFVLPVIDWARNNPAAAGAGAAAGGVAVWWAFLQ